MELLPPPEERAWLSEELARLVLEVGAETLVAAPVLLPDDRTFPDRWQPDARGVYRLARRLMTYAGLAELDLSLDLDRFAEITTRIDQRGRAEVAGHSGTAAWFAGIHDRVSVFGVDLGQLDNPRVLAGTLAHEVAHA